jgi:mevalonate kinase
LSNRFSDLCDHRKPLELFSLDDINCGASLAMSFADRAFLCAHTLMPSTTREATSNHIFLLRPEELMQFYCELQRASEELKKATLLADAVALGDFVEAV